MNMYYPSLKEFLKLSNKGNVIPVYKEIMADLDTPVSAFLKIKKDDYAFLLESVEGQEKIARYSFLGSNPSLIFKSKQDNVQIIYSQKKLVKRFATSLSPLDEIKKIMQGYKSVYIKGLPRFHGGLVGYIGYDTIRFFEEIPDKNADDLKLPDSVFILTDTILVFDHVNHTIKIVTNIVLPKFDQKLSKIKKTRIYYRAIKKIETIYRDFKKSLIHKEKKFKRHAYAIVSNFKKSEFQDII